MESLYSPSALNGVLDHAIASARTRNRGAAHLSDSHQGTVVGHSDCLATDSYPSSMLQLKVSPDDTSGMKTFIDREVEAMSAVDAHVWDRSHCWPPVEHQPHKPRVLMTTRNAPRREVSKAVNVADISSMSRSERIRFLEDLGSSEAKAPSDCTRGARLTTTRRAHQEHLIAGRPPFRRAGLDPSGDAVVPPEDSVGTKSLQARGLRMKAVQLSSNEEGEADDAFSKAVQSHRAALKSAALAGESKGQNAVAMPHISAGSSGGRARKLLPGQHQKHDIETMTSWLTELARAVDDDRSNDVLQHACTDQASLFVKLSKQLQVSAYVLRPHDALQAATLTAKGALLLESYAQALSKQKYNADRERVSLVLEDAVTSLRHDMVAILAAVVARITTADAPYLADTMLAMAESRAGIQEFLDAMLGHMLWLLAAKPRSFQPQVIARIVWALGLMKTEGGAEGETLTAFNNEANIRAIASLQKRMVEVLDDFLDDDIGTLAMDPTSGGYLGDAELRRVLHRAGRLQVGLRPESARYLDAMKRLEASARARLWEPYQAEIMPFMRDYCERLSGVPMSSGKLAVPISPKKQKALLKMPTSLN